MSVTQPPSDTPFGLDANVAAGLAYLFGLVGGIVMLVGGGTNKFVKWAAAQSITLWGGLIAIHIIWGILTALVHIFLVLFPVLWLIDLLWLVLWIWTFVSGFQGKEVRVPVIAGLTESLFKSAL
ncbi:MAG: hypothetical protein WCD38_04945 [Candidatus Tumulicola sp.]